MGADEIYSQYRQKFRACGGQKPARNLITPPLQSTPVTSQEAVNTPGFRPCFHEESMGVTGGFLYFGGGFPLFLDVSSLRIVRCILMCPVCTLSSYTLIQN